MKKTLTALTVLAFALATAMPAQASPRSKSPFAKKTSGDTTFAAKKPRKSKKK